MVSLLRRRASLVGQVYLLLGILVGLIGFVAVSVIGLRQQSESATDHLTTVLLPAQQASTDLSAAYTQQENALHGYRLTRDPAFLRNYSDGHAEATRLKGMISLQLADYPQVMDLLAGVEQAAQAWRQHSADPEIGRAIQGPPSPADSMAEKQRFDTLRIRLADLHNRISEIAGSETATANDEREAANRLTGSVALVSFLVAGGAALLLRRSLTRPLRTLVSQVNQVADGDLDRPVSEVGPPELTTVAQSVETMRTRILDDSRRKEQLQRELTQHEEAERRRTEQDFATVVASLNDGVAVVGATGMVESANPAAGHILGMAESEIVGSAPASWPLFDESGVALSPAENPVMGTWRSGEPENSRVVRLERADGQRLWLAVTSRVLNPREGPPHAVVASFSDITESRLAREQLEYEATHDALTGLLNRQGIIATLAELTAEGHDPVALLFCDIDNFKRVNDSLGHEAGDELLTALARRLRTEVPPGCTVARLSGDEFLIICPNVEAAGGLETLTDQVSDILRTLVPVRNQLVSVSASTGAALLEGTMTGQDLLRYADAAMFHAKSRGPGRVSLASPELITAVQAQLGLEGQLRRALRNDDLTLHYQPIVTHDGTVVEAEALVRWPHPDQGLLSPGVILPVAEQGNLLRELDLWVLRTALAQAASWPATQGLAVSVAVNLAELLPSDPHFVDEINALITESGIAADRVVLELVETALVDLPARSLQSMAELAAGGVRFAIDDFGTGYSSLARLKDMPAQIIKLDRHFVTDIDTDPVDHAVAQATPHIAHAMGSLCIAEGVETTSQLNTLADLGVDLYQGYLFSRPLPVDKFRTLLHPENQPWRPSAGRTFPHPTSDPHTDQHSRLE